MEANNLLILEEKFNSDPGTLSFARLADAYLSLGEVDRAIEVCQKGIEVHPDYISGHVVMGKSYLAAGEYDKARGEFEKVLELDSQNLVALENLAKVCGNMGDREGALEFYMKLLRLDPLNQGAKEEFEKLLLEEEPSDRELETSLVEEQGAMEQAEAQGVELELEDIWEATGEEVLAEEPGQEPVVEESAGEELPTEGDLSTELEVEEVAEGGETGEEIVSPISEEIVEEPEEGFEDSIATVTLAEIYAAQGFVKRAIKMLEKVLEKEPDRENVRNRLEELRAEVSLGEAEKSEEEK